MSLRERFAAGLAAVTARASTARSKAVDFTFRWWWLLVPAVIFVVVVSLF